MSARDAHRERLEGSLLTVCVDCKDMVVQVLENYEQFDDFFHKVNNHAHFLFTFSKVIRVSRTTKRHSRAEFSSITPDNVRDLR